MHCTKEIIQQLRFLLNDLSVPPELEPLICNEESLADAGLPVPQSKVYLVEVSSLKEIRFQDYYLQINRLRGYFSDRPQLAEILFKYYKQAALPHRAKALDAEPAFHACSDFEKELLLTTVVSKQEFSDLLVDLRRILSMFNEPPVFVTHCDVLLRDQPIADRQKLIGYLRTAAQLIGFELFEPTPLIERYGQAFAMADAGRDTSHYSPEFEEILGTELYKRFVEPRRTLPRAENLPETRISAVA